MILVQQVKVYHGGASIRVDIEKHTRGGSLSPTMYVIRYKGRLITPYEQKQRGWTFDMNAIFQMVYSNSFLADLIPQQSPFLSFIKKTVDKAHGKYYPVPVKGRR